MCRSKSSRKYFSALCSGSTAPGARAQKVWPGPRRRQCARQDLQVFRPSPSPSSMASRILATQGSPSRQGVHQPQDSRAKKLDQVEDHAHGAGPVVEDDHRPRAQAAAGLLAASRNPSSRPAAPGEEVRGGAAGDDARRLIPVLHPPACSSRISRIGGPHGKLPGARLLDPAAHAVDLGPPVVHSGSGPCTSRRRLR